LAGSRAHRPKRESESNTGIHQIEAALNFPSVLQNSLKSARFYSYFRVDGSGKPLLVLQDQTPLLLTASAENPGCICLPPAPTLTGTTFPSRPPMSPWFTDCLKEAAGLTDAALPGGIVWGEHFNGEGRPIRTGGIDGGPGIHQFSRPGVNSGAGSMFPGRVGPG